MLTKVQIIESANVNSIPIKEEMFLNWMEIKELLESEWSPEIQESVDVLLDDLEDPEEEELHVSDGAKKDVNVEPVDFENNRVLWLPPKPEDEKKALMYDDDENRDAAGEWGLWSSSSFESGEYRSRDRPNEEQEKVVKNVVDGHFRALTLVREKGSTPGNTLRTFPVAIQGMDHLKMAVEKIDVHQPDVLLVEKSVSRYAQRYLLAEDISPVLNIKRTLLELIAHCTGSQIVPSIDHLPSKKLGYCDMFHVEKFFEEHRTAGQSGKKLVLLPGANGDELKKVKLVFQYLIFVAYHLALETFFLADEGTSELPLNSLIIVALPDKSSTIIRSISIIPVLSIPYIEKTQSALRGGASQISYSISTMDLIKIANLCAQKIGMIEFPNHLVQRKSFLRPHLTIKAF
ncbi:hypothetical protein HAX54_027507 [Datura stramonium]|uniref:Uncharacterized protein n=1 Tax=Datura stramonium TaxID=4076 RepID=A0ABS8V575_DATST|nr:hypothetical protein [Datura stramonium]